MQVECPKCKHKFEVTLDDTVEYEEVKDPFFNWHELD